MRTVLVLALLAALVTGCAGASPAPTATTQPPGEPTATQEPAQTAEPGQSSPPEPTPGPDASGSAGVASPAATIVVPEPSTSPTPGPTPAATPVPRPAATPMPSATPRPTPAATPTVLPLAGLRYRLADAIGRPLFCDPDFYPIARADEAQLAAERYPSIRADAPTYEAIVAHLGIAPSATPADDEILAIYREWKMLNALLLEPAGDRYRFDYVAAAATGEAGGGWHVGGTIDGRGTIAIELREASGPPPCPICLAQGTAIATPSGPVAVEDLRPGMAVWTADGMGRRLAARVSVAGSTPVPPTHRVVHLVLADGRTLEASPGHPLADGRRLGDLQPGDPVDGSWVASAALVPYAGGSTFDLLPSGPSGTYWAGGIQLGSTLRRAP